MQISRCIDRVIVFEGLNGATRRPRSIIPKMPGRLKLKLAPRLGVCLEKAIFHCIQFSNSRLISGEDTARHLHLGQFSLLVAFDSLQSREIPQPSNYHDAFTKGPRPILEDAREGTSVASRSLCANSTRSAERAPRLFRACPHARRWKTDGKICQVRLCPGSSTCTDFENRGKLVQLLSQGRQFIQDSRTSQQIGEEEGQQIQETRNDGLQRRNHQQQQQSRSDQLHQSQHRPEQRHRAVVGDTDRASVANADCNGHSQATEDEGSDNSSQRRRLPVRDQQRKKSTESGLSNTSHTSDPEREEQNEAVQQVGKKSGLKRAKKRCSDDEAAANGRKAAKRIKSEYVRPSPKIDAEVLPHMSTGPDSPWTDATQTAGKIGGSKERPIVLDDDESDDRIIDALKDANRKSTNSSSKNSGNNDDNNQGGHGTAPSNESISHIKSKSKSHGYFGGVGNNQSSRKRSIPALPPDVDNSHAGPSRRPGIGSARVDRTALPTTSHTSTAGNASAESQAWPKKTAQPPTKEDERAQQGNAKSRRSEPSAAASHPGATTHASTSQAPQQRHSGPAPTSKSTRRKASGKVYMVRNPYQHSRWQQPFHREISVTPSERRQLDRATEAAAHR